MIGRTISHFRILAKAGEGGMGVVYQARDTKLDRNVALKFLPRKSGASELDRARFLQEARAASALAHPNICIVHEIDEVEGELFMAMEWIEGKTLRSLIQERQSSPTQSGREHCLEALRISAQIADGLAFAHEHGIIHRDLKSDNIMITADGRVKIMDFGLARLEGSSQGLTLPGTMVGSPWYMSPEQIQGHAVDVRSDLFSLGILLYEMLAGVHPFAGEYDVAVLYSILHADPVPLDALVPGCPPTLSDIAMRCLRKAAEERYQTSKELREELRRAESSSLQEVETGPADARAPSPAPPPETPEKRVFVARGEQLSRLIETLGKVKSGSGRVVFISGESGIGKTSLIHEVLHHARQLSMSVFFGRCLFQEGGLPYHPFASALKNQFRSLDQPVLDLIARKAKGQGIDFSGRLPLLKVFFNLSPGTSGVISKEQLWETLVALFRILASERPAVLVIDDLQWADITTLGLFTFLARSIDQIPILLIGAFRSGDAGGEHPGAGSSLEETVRQLKIEGLATQFELKRFGEEETGELVRLLMDGGDVRDDVVHRTFETTQGNPLFVFELVNLMRADGSVTLRQGKWTLTQRLPEPLRSGRIRDVIEQRLQRISAKEREILEVASCEGDNFGSDTLVACLNIDRITVLKRLQSLEKNHALIRAEKDRYRFDHILIRQIVQESMLFELRQEYHRLIAASLMQRTGDNPEFAARIAYHLNASGQDVAALKYLLMAADQSRVLCAHEDAMRHYLKARETLEQHPHPKSPVRLLVAEGLGDVYTSLGRSQDALREYSLLLGLAREENRRAEEVRALRKSASNLRLLGDAPRAISSGEEALKRALSLGDTDERIKCLNVLALIHSSRGEYGLTIKLSQQALELSKTGNDIRNQSVCLSTVGFAHWHTGEYALAVQELENALVLQRQTGDTHGTASTLNNIGLAYYSIGRYEDALNSQFESLRIKRSFGERPVIPGSLNNIGDTYRDIGDLAKAVRYHKESLALARELQNRGAECDSVRDLGADYLILGDLSSSRSFLEEVLTLSRTYGYVWYETRSCISLAELCLLEDKIEEADSWSSSGQRLASDLHAKLLTIESLWTRSGVLARMASVGQALPVLRQAIAIAEPCGHRPFLWQMYLDMARLYRGGGDPDEAGRVAEKARQIAQNILDEFRDENLKKVFRESAKVAEALNPARDARP